MAKFLIVDDESVNTKLLERILVEFGECVCCHSGGEALDEIVKASREKNNFDAIFLDIMMPRMDGHEILRILRKIESEHMLNKSIVFMVTALDDADSVMDSFMADCQEYLIKPVEKKKLIRKLNKYGISE